MLPRLLNVKQNRCGMSKTELHSNDLYMAPYQTLRDIITTSEDLGLIELAKKEIAKRDGVLSERRANVEYNIVSADRPDDVVFSETPHVDPQVKFKDDLNVVLETLFEFLVEKNRKYGDSVLTPISCFSKLSPVEGVNIRLDDKIKRLMSAQQDETEDVELDLIGYLLIKQVIKLREK